MTLWVVGIMLTIGLLDLKEDVNWKDQVLYILLVVFAWPFVLGVSIRETFLESDAEWLRSKTNGRIH